MRAVLALSAMVAAALVSAFLLPTAALACEPCGSYVYRAAVESGAVASRVYLGGQPVGFTLDIDGVLVAGLSDVDTSCGQAGLRSPLAAGDVIVAIDGKKVKSAEDITAALNGGKEGGTFAVEVLRGGERLAFEISPLIDRVSGEYRLGITVKTDPGGIGTVTYIKQDGRFAALGHAVGSSAIGEAVAGGKVYACKILGFDKGEKGRPGSIRGMLSRGTVLGEVDKSIRYGIYGTIYEPDGQLYDVGKRDEIAVGRAQVCSAITGKREFYDIEIQRVAYRPGSDERGLAIKVTDKRLLALTGGIVQGMSGSPIIQNDKLVGAVTHVFINDPQRGYGVYIDRMLPN